MTAQLVRRVLAEGVGTAFLVAAVVGSGIAASRLSPSDTGLQLLENSIATGAVLVALILALQPVSASFNPVVTLVERALGAVTTGDTLVLVVSQIVGGCLGAVTANLMFGLDGVAVATTERSGAGLWLGEVVATLGLVLVIFGTVRAGRADTVAYAVGGYITAAYWFTSSTSFANPAVTIGRVFTDTFAGIELAPAFEGPSENEPLLEFQVAHPDVMHRRLTEAGLTDVVVDTAHEELVEVRTGQQLWDWTLGGNPIPGMLVADVSEAQRSDIVRVLDGMVRERADRTGVAVFTAPLNIGLGTS